MNQLSSPGSPDPNDVFNRGERYINSSPIKCNRYSNLDSSEDENDSDDEELDIVNRLSKTRRAKADALYKPMSSPIRGEQRSGKGGFRSKSLRSKYTLRTRQYVPFRQRQLLQRDHFRDERTLAQRGGVEEMERFIQAQGHKEDLNKLNAEATDHMFDIEEINEDAINDVNKQSSNGNGKRELNAYEQELEDMLRREEEELEQLTSNLTLG